MIQGKLDFNAPTERVVKTLSKLLGLETATAEYIALRALGEPDAFPSTDQALRRIAGNAHHPLSASELEARAEAWRPWRGYAAMHLWNLDRYSTELNLRDQTRKPTERKRYSRVPM